MSRMVAVDHVPSLDRRTPLELARADLVANLADGDRVTLAAVLLFVDTMRDHLRSRSAMDYSAEALAFGRVASEIELAATAAGMPMPNAEQLAVIMSPPPAPVVDLDADLDQMADEDARSAARKKDLARIINHKPGSAKWNRRRNKRRS